MNDLETRSDAGISSAGGLEEFLQTLIKRRGEAAEKRSNAQQKAEAVVLLAKESGRADLETEEQRDYDKYLGEMKSTGATIVSLDNRIEEIRSEVERTGQINKGLASIRKAEGSLIKVKEAETYTRDTRTKRSWVNDLIMVSMNLDGTGECRERLSRHAQDVATSPSYKEHRNLSRTDGSGGFAVPPAWLMDQYIELARPGRAFANLCQRQPLPGGTDSINIPKILTGTATGPQVGDNTQVPETDLTDTTVRADVVTIAGQQGVSIQLIDQSPIAFDDVIFRDLVASHAATLDNQIISANGTGGTVVGVTNTPGISSIIAGVDAVAPLKPVYSAIANAIQTVHTSRYLPPEVIVMHPRRWGWFLSLLDTDQRPLFLPAANSPMNASGVLQAVDSQQVVGQMHGLPVVTDPNVPTNLGAGTNEDAIFVMRSSDLVLYEGGIRSRVLPETRANSLTVLLQIYSYLAFSAARYPASVVEITGTGLVAPTF